MRALIPAPLFFALGMLLAILGILLIATGGVGAGIVPLILGLLTLARAAQLRHPQR
jgi:hypothetical protein